MERSKKTQFDLLSHTVNSKCSALREAANLLGRISPQRADKMLGLMADQVLELETAIVEFRKVLLDNLP